MPGIKIVSPMTPNEYANAYLDFMDSDDVVYVSEHRGAYGNTEELLNIEYDIPDIVLFPISITRFAAVEASKELEKEGYKVAVHHIVNIKPFNPTENDRLSLKRAKHGIVLDDDYVDGIAKSLAFDLSKGINADMHVMGLKDKSAGFYPQVDNLPPSKDEIVAKIKEILK